MQYKEIKQGYFLARPNRFIAHVELDGQVEVCHVKNTGRCRELLTPRAVVYVECHDDPKRKTKYSLIAVEKGGLLINMDSQAPNKVVGEWLASGELLPGLTLLKPECRYGASRFDFCDPDARSDQFYTESPHTCGFCRSAAAGTAGWRTSAGL